MTTHSPPSSAKLPLMTKLAFGAGDIGPAMVAAITGFFLLFFLTDVVRMSPSQAGVLLLVSTLWDAISDPLVGMLSDRTRTRWGRRRPWLLLGAIPFGLSFFLLFYVPSLGESQLFWYYLIVLVFHKTMYTVVNVPYTALTPELTQDYDERTNLNSYRFGFSIISALMAAVLHPIIVGSAATPQEGYLLSASIWAVAITVPFFFAVWGTYEDPSKWESRERTIGFVEGVKIALGNRAFRYVSGIYLLSWLVVNCVSTVIIYYANYWLGRPDPTFISSIILAVQGSALLWLIIWSYFSNRLGKKGIYYRGMIFWILVSMTLFMLPSSAPTWLVVLLGFLAGIGVSTAYLVPWAMLPDVIELNELETGERQEGVFYGFFVFLQKLGVAFGLFLIAQLLEATGYITPPPGGEATVTQPESALFTIRLLIGPIPALILAAGIYLVYRFPITKEQHEQTLAALAQRRSD